MKTRLELQLATFIITASLVQSSDKPCLVSEQAYGRVCVCDSNYCDTIGRPTSLPRGEFYHYRTSSASPGFSHTQGSFTNDACNSCEEGILIEIDNSIQYQEIIGFGGAFTDSAAFLFHELNAEAQESFIESYFGPTGIEYTKCRIPIGGSDFSLREYTLDDVYGDENLDHFELAVEDYNYKIPMIKRAMEASPRDVSVAAATWTAPSWMKTQNISGYIKPEYYNAWALYHVKFLEAYRDNGIDIWAISGGNEPYIFKQLDYPTNWTLWQPDDYTYWCKECILPEMSAANFDDVKFIVLDDARNLLLFWMKSFSEDEEAYEALYGIGVHWYLDYVTVPKIMNDFHTKYPDKVILYTESSVNAGLRSSEEPAITIGSWARAEIYIHNIIENINHWASGFIDWNLALDTSGGPTLQDPIDAPVLVNATTGEFYKQPIFYAIGHFSKFIPPGSRRVNVKSNQEVEAVDEDFENMKEKATYDFDAMSDWFASWNNEGSVEYPPIVIPPIVHCLATKNSDSSYTVILCNPTNDTSYVDLFISDLGCATLDLEPHSIHSIVYW